MFYFFTSLRFLFTLPIVILDFILLFFEPKIMWSIFSYHKGMKPEIGNRKTEKKNHLQVEINNASFNKHWRNNKEKYRMKTQPPKAYGVQWKQSWEREVHTREAWVEKETAALIA